MQRVPRSQTRIRVAIPRVNPGSEPVQPPRLAGVWTVADTQTEATIFRSRVRSPRKVPHCAGKFRTALAQCDGVPAQCARVTYSFLSFLGTVSYRIRILMYLDVSFMYLDCILMCPVHIHQDTSRYIKIHLYLVVSGTLAVSYQGECILLLRYI